MKLNINHIPDLTVRPPRSPRVRLGGYVILPRVLDKGRATLAGKNGEYKYGNPLDRRLFDFTGIAPDALLARLKTGAGDGDILQWLVDNVPVKRAPWEVEQWSAFMERFNPGTPEFRERLSEAVAKVNPARRDINTVFDMLDLDDFVSFGGKA